MTHPFEQFLDSFIPQVTTKCRQLNKVSWVVETTGSSDAADVKCELETDVKQLFGDKSMYEKLMAWDRDSSLQDPLIKRQLNVLIREVKQNLMPLELAKEISQKEAELLCMYANFRPMMNGKALSENDIREILKKENDRSIREKAWEASKEIGEILAPRILTLANLRNQVAKNLGYTDYFEMQLDVREVSESWLFRFLSEFAFVSEAVHTRVLEEVEQYQCQTYRVTKEELGPWAWSEPFGQEDPIDTSVLDGLVNGIDICKVAIEFYQKMGFDVTSIIKRSDMYERPGKNQHAFCMNIDRDQDVRTLNNIKNSMKWLDTILHELGHAVYESNYDPKLPWLLRKPPHIMLTEGMALLAGRQAFLPDALASLVGNSQSELIKKAEQSLKRKQIIFSRWALVMTHFEKELYRNPKQDLNQVWWNLVNKYQKIPIPKNREGKKDWAAKYHIAFDPVYYYGYLLGEMFASSVEEVLLKETGVRTLTSAKTGDFLRHRLFALGNSLNWSDTVMHTTCQPFHYDAWLRQYS